MRRILLSPTWLIGHVLVLAAFVTCLWLGWWQLSRYDSPTGSVHNVGYALQWPVFGAFGLFFWLRVIRADLRPPATEAAQEPAEPAAPAEPDGATSARIAADEQADPELAAYNRYLAQLHAAGRRD